MKYFFGFSLSLEADHRAHVIAEDLHARFRVKNVFEKYIPHITVKIPFVGSVGNKAELISFMEKFVNGRKAIPIEMKGFGHFNIGVVYWDVLQESEALTVFQEELCNDLECITWVTFDSIEPSSIPHVSVGEGDIRGRFKTIYDYLKSTYRRGIAVNLDTLHLFQKPPHEHKWESVATFALQ